MVHCSSRKRGGYCVTMVLALLVSPWSCTIRHPGKSANSATENAQLSLPSANRAQVRVTITRDSIELTLFVPTEMRQKDDAPLLLRVRNLRREALQLLLGGRPPAADFIVENAATHQQVWRAMAGIEVLRIQSRVVLR